MFGEPDGARRNTAHPDNPADKMRASAEPRLLLLPRTKELLNQRIHVAELIVGESSDNAGVRGVRGVTEDREDAPDGPRELVLLNEPHHLLDDLHDLVVLEHIAGLPEHPLIATAAQIAHDVGVNASDVNVETLSAVLRVKERLRRDGSKLDDFHFVSLL